MGEKLQKKSSLFKIIAFQYGTASFHNPEQDTCHRQSMC